MIAGSHNVRTGFYKKQLDKLPRHVARTYVIDGDTNVWYWIGSHEDYNDFIGGS